jgi:energy-coupling factor transporter ATP-binding protein EcfA2
MFGLFGRNPHRNPKAWLLSADPKALNKAIAQIATYQMMSGQEPDPWRLLGELSDDELWQCVGNITKSSGYKHPMMQQFMLPETGEIANLFSVAQSGKVDQINADLVELPELPATATQTKHFDWSNIHKHAHSAIVGSTGTGKTTLTTWLASQLQGETLVIDPHYCAGDWSGMHVVGAGQNYSEIADVMQLALAEMAKRYKLRNQGQREFTPLTLIIEEVGSIADDPASADTCKYFLPKMLRESRKTGIKLFLLNHGGEVDQWGLKGKGSIRACMNIVRLGQFAIDHAKSLKDQAIIDAVNHMHRPAMVDNLPALIPDLSSFDLPPSDRVVPGFLSGSRGDCPGDANRYQDEQIIDAVVSSPQTASCLEQASQLSEPLRKLVKYAHRKQGWITANQAKTSIRIFRDDRTTTTGEIRNYFEWLASRGIGQVNDDGDYRCICPYD